MMRAFVLGICCGLIALGWWYAQYRGRLATLMIEPQGIMGTTCTLVVAAPSGSSAAVAALERAELALRRTESGMSTWIEASPISQLNRAPVGTVLPVPDDLRAVLQRAQQARQETDGAFDISCGPLVRLWRKAGADGRLPSEAQRLQARVAGLDDLRLSAAGAQRLHPDLVLDVGGIAKGWAIDRAAEVLAPFAGIVDVGGDVRCVGQDPQGLPWPVALRSPFTESEICTLRIRDRAVCTSGDYARFVVIDGQRYSHIVDPRTGLPAQGVVSSTVIAQDTMTADIWATALSVLGEAGLARLPEEVEALLIIGNQEQHRLVYTPGFLAWVEGGALPEHVGH